MKLTRIRSLIIFGILACTASVFSFAQAVSSASPQHLFFHVTLGPQIAQPVSGRLLIFLKPGTKLETVEIGEFAGSGAAGYVAAKDVSYWRPGESVDLDTDNIAFPAGFSQVKSGDYVVQAVLDVNHDFNYSGRTPGDLTSAPTALANWTPGQGAEPQLALTQTIPPPDHSRMRSPLSPAEQQAAQSATQPFDFVSPALSAWWGRPIHMGGWVVLPPGYVDHPKQRYPTIYWTHGFGGNLRYSKFSGLMIYQRMAQGKMPPMIWVMLDESLPTGTHEFADSVNNGPWGTALTTELMPHLEHTYRMDARVSGRFLNGHSSGGWATLWLQVTYPKIFGGTWSTSPDPSDFHDFTGIDLYAPHANVYHRADGTLYPIMRDHGKVLATFEQFAKMEEVLGPYGGQVASFEWVFSPRGPGGRPEPMFNRATGDVDPKVVAYWRDHYDIAHRVTEQWPQIGPDLRGKIHLIVGTADTFYLDGAAHRLDSVLAGLHADAHFTYIPNRTHFDLYRVDKDRSGLFDQISAEMYALARPHAHWKSASVLAPAKAP